MSRTSWLIGAALGCMTATGVGFAAPPDRTPPPLPPQPAPERAAPAPADRAAPAVPADNRAAPTLRMKDVMGSKVSLKGGLAIGTVSDIIFDDDGYVDYVVVQNEGKDVIVPWEAAKFDFDNRVATVDIAPEKFKEIPTYTVQTWPNVYEPAFREKIYTYYGVTPRREIRRDIRRERP